MGILFYPCALAGVKRSSASFNAVRKSLIFRVDNARASLSVSYSIDPDRGLVVSRLWGTLTEDDVREHNRKLRVDPAFDPGYRQLIDATGLTEILVGTQTITQTARDQYFTPGTRRALVATSEAAFGLARMFATRAEASGQTIEVFRDKARAEEWLGLEATN
jgi:hypothetical protein